MEQAKIDRINELARLAKERELTDEEAQERAALRKEYVEEYRQNLKQQLDNIVIQRPDGTQERLKPKG